MRKTHGTCLLAIGMLAMVNCDAESPDAGERYVLLDADARAAGYSLSIDGRVSDPVLPVLLEDGAQAVLVSEGGRTVLEVEPGELVHVRGQRAEIESLSLGEEIDPDRLQIDASLEAATELAHELGAELIVGEDGRLELRDEGLLAKVAETTADDDVRAVHPVAAGKGSVGAERPDVAHAVLGSTARSASAKPLIDEQELSRQVAVWSPLWRDLAAANRRAAFDAELDRRGVPPAVTCEDPAAGTWVAHDYVADDRERTDWKLHIAPAQGKPGRYLGKIENSTWYGAQDAYEVAPKECGDSDWRYQVTMVGEGQLGDDGQLTFEGRSWKSGRPTCGQPLGADGYNLDHFAGEVADSRFASVNNDGGRMVEHPTHFRRISCK